MRDEQVNLKSFYVLMATMGLLIVGIGAITYHDYRSEVVRSWQVCDVRINQVEGDDRNVEVYTSHGSFALANVEDRRKITWGHKYHVRLNYKVRTINNIYGEVE